MKRPTHPLLIALALAVAGGIAACAHAPPPPVAPPAPRADPALLGCWRGDSQRVRFRDGREQTLAGPCTMEFGKEELVIRCPAPREPSVADVLQALKTSKTAGQSQYSSDELQRLMDRPVVSVYRYALDRPGHYLATLAERAPGKPAPPPQAASYLVMGERLEITVDDPPNPELARIQSMLLRAPAAEAGECLPPPAR